MRLVKYLFLIIIMGALGSCKIFYPDLLLKTKSEQNLSSDTLALKTGFEYTIQPGDRFRMFIYPNKGYQLADVLSVTTQAVRTEVDYYVKKNGYVSLPVIDSFKLQGLTISQAEMALKQNYSAYFINPFIKITLTNRRVYVIRSRSISNVVDLENENMNLLEVLAKSGGLVSESKASRIKIVRGDLKKPIVKFIDLSKVSALSNEDLKVYPNDVIYVEPQVSFLGAETQIAPILSVLTSLFIIYSIVNQIKL